MGVPTRPDDDGKRAPRLRLLPARDWNEHEGWALYGCGGEPTEAELADLSSDDALLQCGRGDCGRLHATEGCLEQGLNGMLRLDLPAERPDASVFSGPRLGSRQRVVIAKNESETQHQGGRDRTPIPPRTSDSVAHVRRIGRSASERLNRRLKAQFGLAKSRATKAPRSLPHRFGDSGDSACRPRAYGVPQEGERCRHLGRVALRGPLHDDAGLRPAHGSTPASSFQSSARATRLIAGSRASAN